MKRWLKNNSLSLVMFGLFITILIGQSITGLRNYNTQQQEHKQPDVSYINYIKSGDFVEAIFENWESEFLQMGSFVILTVWLRQRGSAESKKVEGEEAVDQKPRKSKSRHAPWPVKKGGVALRIYSHSLSIAFLLLFVVSFGLHAYGGSRATCEENLAHNQQACESAMQYVGTSKFWYESFQNWQSEYLAVGAIVIFSVYLREKGSPESKPVNTPHGASAS